MASAPADLTVENLTPHVIRMGSNISNERVKTIFAALIQHAHELIRETKLTTEEWEVAWQYLTRVGQYCTPDRQEMILLSDVLGISALVDAINNSMSSATESSVLGPFHNPAHEFEHGQSIASKGAIGEPMLIRGTVSSSVDGKSIEGVKVDIWETNGNGFYDMQDPEKTEPDCRGIFYTDTDGRFALVGVRSVDYPIPSEGPVGDLLKLLSRSNIRPAHVHFVLEKDSFVKLTTALYSADSVHIAGDPVFGVKRSLIKKFTWTSDLNLGKEYGIDTLERTLGNGERSNGFWLLEHDFVLAPR